ncbi:YqjD family protein [Polynucleobacter sp. UK-Kesae-W10]|uniref:DUF883 family protein n=1 Tax=Polynucleobacter sp. UK-Kesae-W10 TaxID=1819738 RepID=UPI001C0B77AA|nr:DUF883 family protein [Polynucleobacter sp. UK-Kesae-W10]MBU3577612.1 DUF883 domain-containing protein [Polynucleobacter sp. UK-Kesae-W10]
MTGKKIEHMTASEAPSVGADQLVSEFKSLMADAEALIKATEDHPGDAISSLRNKALETLSGAKQSLSNLEGTLADKAKVVAEGADDFVHRNPWEAVGVAAGLGLLLGLFIRRR